MLYALVLAYVMRDLGMSKKTAGFLYTLTLLASGIGGVFFGFLADRIGRKRALMFSILTYSVCSFASGLSTTVLMLAVFRFILGLGMGGEWNTGRRWWRKPGRMNCGPRRLPSCRVRGYRYALAALVAGLFCGMRIGGLCSLLGFCRRSSRFGYGRVCRSRRCGWSIGGHGNVKSLNHGGHGEHRGMNLSLQFFGHLMGKARLRCCCSIFLGCLGGGIVFLDSALSFASRRARWTRVWNHGYGHAADRAQSVWHVFRDISVLGGWPTIWGGASLSCFTFLPPRFSCRCTLWRVRRLPCSCWARWSLSSGRIFLGSG